MFSDKAFDRTAKRNYGRSKSTRTNSVRLKNALRSPLMAKNITHSTFPFVSYNRTYRMYLMEKLFSSDLRRGSPHVINRRFKRRGTDYLNATLYHSSLVLTNDDNSIRCISSSSSTSFYTFDLFVAINSNVHTCDRLAYPFAVKRPP